MRKFLILTLLAFCVAAQAQSPARKEVPTVKVAPGMTQLGKAQVDPVASLQAQVRVMRAQIQELKRQLDLVLKDAQMARANVPQCSADLRTSSSAQGSRSCEPYACDAVVGTCLMSCATTNDCAPGTACDIGAARCVRPSTE